MASEPAAAILNDQIGENCDTFYRAIYEIESPHFLSILRPFFLSSFFKRMQILPIDSSHVASGKEGGSSV